MPEREEKLVSGKKKGRSRKKAHLLAFGHHFVKIGDAVE
jgi:hypothetical protein